MTCKCKEYSKLFIKVKRHRKDSVLPTQAHDNDAGYDLTAIDCGDLYYEEHTGKPMFLEYDTGISIQPPEGYHTEIIARSSITKKDLMVKNSLGLIDRDYTGTLRVRFYITNGRSDGNFYKTGEKIAQILIRKTIHADFVEVDSLIDTVRGDGGFGSSGK